MALTPTVRRNQGGTMAPRRDRSDSLAGREMDNLLERLFGGRMFPFDRDFSSMRVWDFDVREDDKEVVVRAEVPGFEESEIDVQLDEDVLSIRAEKEQKGERELEYRSFFRSVTLPRGIDVQHASATYRNGVLELRLPRSEESKPRRIAVQAGNGQQSQSAQRAEGTAAKSAAANAQNRAGNSEK